MIFIFWYLFIIGLSSAIFVISCLFLIIFIQFNKIEVFKKGEEFNDTWKRIDKEYKKIMIQKRIKFYNYFIKKC